MMLLSAAFIDLALLSCGLFVAVILLRFRDPFAILGMTFVFGSTVFFLLANGLAYVLPITSAFRAALGAIVLLDLALMLPFWRVKHEVTAIFASHRRPVFFLLALITIVGFANARFLGSDPWSWQHFPLAATIAAGNFPVMSPIDPLSPLHYHYAPALLAAGWHLLTGLPLSAGFAVQPLIGAAGILCFVAALVRFLGGSVRASLLCAVLALAGGGLTWLKGPELSALFRTFVLQSPVDHALRGLGNLVASPLTTSPLVFLGHRSTATGFPLLYGALFSIAAFLKTEEPRGRIALGTVGFIFALSLTLTMELAFATLCIAASLFALALLAMPQTRLQGRRMVMFGLYCLLPALLIGLVHGGVLSGLGGDGHSFIFHPSLRVTYDTFGSTTVPWSIQFLRDFGLPLLLLPFALVFAWRRREAQPAWLLLLLLGLIHLLLPFLFEYQLIQGEMRRSFYAATSIFSLLAGITVIEQLLSSQKKRNIIIGWIVAASMLLAATLYLVLRLVIPSGRLEHAPLFAQMPAPSTTQEAMYAWIRENTTQDDFFYVRNLTVDFEQLSDEAMQLRDRVLLTTYTGRFTVGPIIFWDYDETWLKDVMLAETECSADAMQRLRVRYLVVETQERAVWFRRNCRSSDWSLRYEAAKGNMQFPRIYELTAG